MAYEYLEYPRLLHKGEARLTVRNDDEKKAALKDGWSLTADAAPEGPVEATEPPADAPVLEPVALVPAKKKPGRKPKAD